MPKKTSKKGTTSLTKGTAGSKSPKTAIVVRQDTSTNITGREIGIAAATPAGAVASISDAIANCVNVYRREKELTKRVQAECAAAVAIARVEVEMLEVQKASMLAILAHRAKDRDLLKEQLDLLWQRVELFDRMAIKVQEANDANAPAFIQQYFSIQALVIEKIAWMFHDYSTGGTRRPQLRLP